MSVTADQAFEARDAGEPVMISHGHAVKLMVSHGQDPNEFFAGRVLPMWSIDLADILEWLGY